MATVSAGHFRPKTDYAKQQSNQAQEAVVFERGDVVVELVELRPAALAVDVPALAAEIEWPGVSVVEAVRRPNWRLVAVC